MYWNKMAFIAHILLMVVLALCTGKIRSEACSPDQIYKCQEPYFRHRNVLKLLEWPMADAVVNASQQLVLNYCRASNDSAHCLLSLPVRCAHDAAFLQQFAHESSWYAAEMLGVTARTCQLDINPLRFARASSHCQEQLPGFIGVLLQGNSSELARASHSATSAQYNACEALRQIAAGFQGAVRADLLEKCGREAVEVLQDGHQQLYGLHCVT
ncbi:uncharacterized protein LOC129599562 [Paramacrobiotus metropolitanus]|uniref:uncharacterized protein LOC129599562 n=1 Tax=Paramacrobiotus metropolitanus TaxID=2943436 RepID=UPI002445E839|nr:uncharacterized protein LOC129599562 [Paramacrobiotus metropolitanus]